MIRYFVTVKAPVGNGWEPFLSFEFHDRKAARDKADFWNKRGYLAVTETREY